MPHTGEKSIEANVKKWAESTGQDGDDYWEENKGKILKTANRHGALDVAGANAPLNARQRRHKLRAELRAQGDADEWKFEEGDEIEVVSEKEEERGSWWKFVAGWLMGRWNP